MRRFLPAVVALSCLLLLG
jgi:hypothetical protein